MQHHLKDHNLAVSYLGEGGHWTDRGAAQGFKGVSRNLQAFYCLVLNGAASIDSMGSKKPINF